MKLGSFEVIEKTGGRYYGQIIWLLRCHGCGAEMRWYTQKVLGPRACAPPCKCAGPLPPDSFDRHLRGRAVADRTGTVIGSFTCTGPTDGRNSNGEVLWSFQCTCGRSRCFTASFIAKTRFRKSTPRCECQKLTPEPAPSPARTVEWLAPGEVPEPSEPAPRVTPLTLPTDRVEADLRDVMARTSSGRMHAPPPGLLPPSAAPPVALPDDVDDLDEDDLSSLAMRLFDEELRTPKAPRDDDDEAERGSSNSDFDPVGEVTE